MDRHPQNGFKSSSHTTRSPSPTNGATNTASRSASSSRANHNFTANTNGGDLHHEPTPQYGAASQAPHAVAYQQPALKISDLLQSPTAISNGNGNGNICGHEQSNPILPPLNPKKDTVTGSTEPTESYSETFKPLEHAIGPGSIGSPLTHPNGVSIFPNLSAAEQEQLSREALDQAGESIIADDSADSIGSVHGDDAGSDAGSDAGYDSDSASSASTSVMSSVRDYMYENGRRYHRYREGTYNFPNDDVEQEREDMKHAMVKLLCSQKLHFAPIGDNPQEILDIGTGTGIWPIEMGDKYLSAHILGIDLSPIQPDWLPPNVRFMVDDVESPWLHPRNHFDYIHSRHTVMAVRDWMKLFRRAIEHLKIGGWIELQEIHHTPKSALPDGNGEMPPEHPVARYWKHVTEGLAALGIDLDTASDGRISDMMQSAGFTNVTERVLHVPIGTWPKNKVLKTVGLYWRTILLDGIQAIALGPLTRGLGWNREQVEVLLMEVRQAYFDDSKLMYMPFHVIYAQRP
ncbi:S-adenosyl-L-methionine-dependent methyltransferase [Trichoderma evansii]